LWSTQHPDNLGADANSSLNATRRINWPLFVSNVAEFAHELRLPTPCCVQSEKRHRDLFHRTFPVTGGVLDVDLHRPVVDRKDRAHVVGGKLIHRRDKLVSKPRDAMLLSVNYVESLRSDALRVERALPRRIPPARMRHLLKDRRVVHQDDLVNLLCDELHTGECEQALPPSMIAAFVAKQRTNKLHEIDVDTFICETYKPAEEKSMMDEVNDGLNKKIRGHRPPRERPPNSEQPQHKDYGRARQMMDQIHDAVALVEISNGGQVKASSTFHRFDEDNDSYISLTDLEHGLRKLKISFDNKDLHALFSALDKNDDGSVDIGEFTRNFEVHHGSILERMQKPVKCGGAVQLGEQEPLGSNPAPGAGGKSSDRMRSQISRVGSAIATPGKMHEAEPILKPLTRHGATIYPDTRHITEANVPGASAYLSEYNRLKTTNQVRSIHAVQGPDLPHIEDKMRKCAAMEFRVERIRNRREEFEKRALIANEVAREFDDLKVARKAMNLLSYEMRCKHAMC